MKLAQLFQKENKVFSNTDVDSDFSEYEMDYDLSTHNDWSPAPVEGKPTGKLINLRKPWRQGKDNKKSNKRDKKNSRLVKQKMFDNENDKSNS